MNNTISLEEHTVAGKAIMFYIAQDETIMTYSYDGCHNNNSKIKLQANITEYIVKYNEEDILITRDINSSKLYNFELGGLDYNISIELSSKLEVKLIKEFIEKCIEYYKEDIMEMKFKAGQISMFVYDKFWVSLSKRDKRSINSLYLPNKYKIINDIKKFIKPKTKEQYKLLGIPYKRNYLLEGLPGTGKSSLVHVIASELDLSICILNFTNNIDDITFTRALQKLPKKSILLLEDIDCLFMDRKANDNLKNIITFSGLLNALDGIVCKSGLITFMTTNYSNKLDPALKRPGRIDKVYQFSYVKPKEIKEMYNIFYPSGVDIDKFLKIVKNDNKLKLTTAMLQEYFYTCLIDDLSIIDNYNLLESIYNEHKQNTQDYYL